MSGKKLHKPHLLLIGNGFDIHHGLASKYIDFIKISQSEKESIYGEDKEFSKHFNYLTSINRDLKWIDVEVEIEHLHNSINRFVDERCVVTSSNGFDYQFHPYEFNFFEEILNGAQILALIENVFSKRDIKLKQGLTISRKNYIDFVEDIIDDFEVLIGELRNYIRHIDFAAKATYDSRLRDYLDGVIYMINYNYTSTTSRMYGDENKLILRPHGVWESDIVLGISYNKAARLFKKVSKEVQVISKNHTIHSSEWSRIKLPFRITEDNVKVPDIPFTMAVMGHSLGETDWHTLKRFFMKTEENRLEKIYVFYHDKNSKVELIQNVISMVGLEAALKDIEDNRIQFIDYKELLPEDEQSHL